MRGSLVFAISRSFRLLRERLEKERKRLRLRKLARRGRRDLGFGGRRHFFVELLQKFNFLVMVSVLGLSFFFFFLQFSL